jgi:cysteine desulfurase family protein (TIGR01976 family)
MNLDLDAVRAAFPALDGEWTYMDNAGGSQCLRSVAERITDYLLRCNVQHGASYEPSVRAGERLLRAQARLAEFVGAREPREIVFGASTTQLLANLAASISRRLAPGDEVVVTDVDHEANVGCWTRLQERGIVVRTWPVHRETLALRREELDPLLGPRTKLVCFTAASNVVGTLHDVASLVRRIHEAGALSCVDAVAFAPHRLLDVRAWDVDLLAFSTYKTYGPHLGVLYGKAEVLLGLPGINHWFIRDDDIPYKFQPGNACFELSDGASAVVDYLESLGGGAGTTRERLAAAFDAICRHEEALAERVLAFLRSRRDVTIHGSALSSRTQRVPTISFTVQGRSSESIVRALDARRIGARHGHFYARRLVERLGLPPADGVVRISLVHYNSLAEADALVRALAEET